jgi:hypothetical protein
MDYQQFTSIQHTHGRPGGVFVAFSRCHCGHGPFSFSRSADRKTVLEGYKNGEKILSDILSIFVVFDVNILDYFNTTFCMFTFLFCKFIE